MQGFYRPIILNECLFAKFYLGKNNGKPDSPEQTIDLILDRNQNSMGF